MDLIFFLIGIFNLKKNNAGITLAMYFILSTTFLNTKFTYLSGWNGLILIQNPTYVSVVLMIILIFFLRKRKSVNMDLYGLKIKQTIFLFFLFLATTGLYDIIEGVRIYEIFKFIICWVPLFIIIFASRIKEIEFYEVLKIISNIIIFICSIYLLQELAGVRFLFSATECNGYTPADNNAPLLPIFSNLVLFLEIINYFSHSKRRRLYSIVIIFVSLLLAKSFGAFSTAAGGSLFLLLLNNKNIISKVSMTAVGAFLLFFSLSISEKATERFLPKIQEIPNAFANINQAYNNSNSDQTFIFRMAMFNERLDYIVHDPVRILRGIGFIHERSFTQHNFKIGLNNEETGKTIQLDTSDIAWSLFAIRFGIIGSLIWLLIVISLFKGIWKYRRTSPLSYVIITYMIFEILAGFSCAICFEAYFLIIPILTYFQLRNQFLLQQKNTPP